MKGWSCTGKWSCNLGWSIGATRVTLISRPIKLRRRLLSGRGGALLSRSRFSLVLFRLLSFDDLIQFINVALELLELYGGCFGRCDHFHQFL